jgi:hypothetical protein
MFSITLSLSDSVKACAGNGPAFFPGGPCSRTPSSRILSEFMMPSRRRWIFDSRSFGCGFDLRDGEDFNNSRRVVSGLACVVIVRGRYGSSFWKYKEQVGELASGELQQAVQVGQESQAVTSSCAVNGVRP